jgi:hypothetical protein
MLENFVETKLRNSQGYSKYGEKISELISKVSLSHTLSVAIVEIVTLTFACCRRLLFLFLSNNNRDTTPTHKKSSSRDS